MPTPPSRDTLDANEADFDRGLVTRDGFLALCSAEHHDKAASIGACSASLARLAQALERGPLQLFEPDGRRCVASDFDTLRGWARRHLPVSLAEFERRRSRGQPAPTAVLRDDAADELSACRAALAASGASTAAVDALVRAIAAATDAESLPALVAQLEAEADRLPWPHDRDYAALALQAASACVDAPALRAAMLHLALQRARRCAAAATSGGEGRARSAHVAEIEALRSRTTRA